MTKVNIKVKEYSVEAQRAFRQTVLILHRNTIQVISEPGAFEGFEGDIVDKGLLRQNQRPPQINGLKATLRNTVAYGIYVRDGYTLRNGKRVRGRDWMKEGVKRTNLQGTFKALLKAKL